MTPAQQEQRDCQGLAILILVALLVLGFATYNVAPQVNAAMAHPRTSSSVEPPTGTLILLF